MRAPMFALAAGAASIAFAAPLLAADAAKPAAAPAPRETPAAKDMPAVDVPTAAGEQRFAGAAKLPPFAAELAEGPTIASASAWTGDTGSAAWDRIARSGVSNRQSIRWEFARALIGAGRAADALGVLEVMRGSDPDLELVAQWRLARGAALTMVGHNEDAIVALAMPELERNPEACAWRMRALIGSGAAEDAVHEVNCAIPAINARPAADRRPFVLAAASAAIETGQPKPALKWLELFGDQNAAANLLRGRALIAMGQNDAGRLRLERAQISGGPVIAADARLSLLEIQINGRTIAPADAVKQLEALRFGWRGGPVERRALRLELKLAAEANDLRSQLRAGAALFRYFTLGKDAGPMLTTLQGQLAAMLAPGSGVALPEAAGLYWDYRELAPAGAEGDMLVLHLADRLQSEGLYARAAELLQYQLLQRTQDVAQGPLSVKVATLHILAGKPDRAIEALRITEQAGYSEGMRQDRKRIEAIALHRLGKNQAALAALEGVPDGEAIRTELFWRQKNWESFAALNQARLPGGNTLDPADQAVVLRQVVALAMLGRESQLQALRARYAAAFRPLPSGKAFDVLTGDTRSVDPAALGTAMAAIPDASPAGGIGDLLDSQ